MRILISFFDQTRPDRRDIHPPILQGAGVRVTKEFYPVVASRKRELIPQGSLPSRANARSRSIFNELDDRGDKDAHLRAPQKFDAAIAMHPSERQGHRDELIITLSA